MNSEREKEAEILAQEIHENLLESCRILRKIVVSKGVFKRKGEREALLGIDLEEYGEMAKEFKEGLSQIENLVKEGTALSLFAKIEEFYNLFCMMKRARWESDVRTTHELSRAISDFTVSSGKVIGFLKGK